MKLNVHPVVYGKTDVVDYRILAFPECIKEHVAYVWKIIENNLLVSPQLLDNTGSEFRWLVLPVSNYIVFGVASFAKNFEEITFNKSEGNKRPFVVFLGYALKASDFPKVNNFIQLMGIQDNFKVYQPNCSYINKFWNDKIKRSPITEDVIEIEFENQENGTNWKPFKFKYEKGKKTIYSSKSNANLWSSALTNTANLENIVLGLGLPNEDKVRNSVFSDASIVNYNNQDVLYLINIEKDISLPNDKYDNLEEENVSEKKTFSKRQEIGSGRKFSKITQAGLVTTGIGLVAKNPPIALLGLTITIFGFVFNSKNTN